MAASVGFIAPFPKAPISGYDFGTKVPPGGWTGTGSDFGWPIHLGTDFGTPAGETIVAPAAGEATFRTGLYGYGNTLTEKFANGWELLFGHVAGGISGPVQQGQPIGITGANVGDSKGAVTLVQLLNPSGQSVNPDPFIGGLFGDVAHSRGQDIPGAPATWPGGNPNAPPLTGLAAPGQQPTGNVDPFGITALSQSIAGIPTSVGHGLADFLAVSEADIAEWFKRQSVAFFVAAVVLLVLFL